MAATKKTKKLRTRIVFVQDETGSMSSIAAPTVSAFNEYFSTLRNEDGLGDVDVTVWQFSDTTPNEDRVRLLHSGALADVPELREDDNYAPRGVTPLLDAVGTALAQASKEKADRILFIVQTDGLENASRDFSREQVAAALAEKEADKKWTVVMLGQGIANWATEARSMGASMDSSFAAPASAHGTLSAYGSLSGQTVALLRTNSPSDKRLAAKAQADVGKKAEKK